MTKIIFNADDFGYSKGINYGIIEAFKSGVLTSTTLMVTMPGTKHAVDLMRENKGLAVGLHLNISLGEPITKGKTLVGNNNKFIKPKNLKEGYRYDKGELRLEIEAQYNRFIEVVGKKPSHIDTHLFSSDKIPEMRMLCSELAIKERIPMRNFDLDFTKHVEFIQHRSFNSGSGLNYILENIEDILKYEHVEIMSHPGYADNYVMKNSSYNIQRTEELEFLISQKLKGLIKEKKIKLINYYDVMK